MMWTVGGFWCVTVSMVHTVQYGISPWGKIGTSLTYPGKEVEKPFPEFVHYEHLVCRIPMQEETLAK